MLQLRNQLRNTWRVAGKQRRAVSIVATSLLLVGVLAVGRGNGRRDVSEGSEVFSAPPRPSPQPFVCNPIDTHPQFVNGNKSFNPAGVALHGAVSNAVRM